jgi:hypothetical protein
MDCPVTINVLDWLDGVWRRLTNRDIGIHSLPTLLSAIAPHRARTPASRHRLLLRSTLVAETIYTIWLQRNRALHDDDQQAFSVPGVRALARQRILRATTTLSSLSLLRTHNFPTLVDDLHRFL